MFELSSLRWPFTIDWNDGMLGYWMAGFGSLGKWGIDK